MVKVRLMENKVNNHAGKLYVIQNRTVGNTPSTERITRPKRPNGVAEVFSVIFMLATEVATASVTLERAAAAADVSASEIAAFSAAISAMVDEQVLPRY